MTHALAYYNDNDTKVCAWLRSLVSANLISNGEVDSRSIADVKPEDVAGYRRVHFFAGIGGWDYALQLAGWPDDRPVWTGSCPCQPFSCAGKGLGEKDPRHLWPEFRRLIAECHPPTIFGEQVASKAGREWLAGVRADLEALGYAVGAADLCAAGASAPHLRQRIYWVADATGRIASDGEMQRSWEYRQRTQDGFRDAGMDDTQYRRQAIEESQPESRSTSGVTVDRLGNAAITRPQEQWCEYRTSGERCSGLAGLAVQAGVPEWNGPTVAVVCSDGPRRVSSESDAFPLAHGLPGRMAQLRGLGNAIVPQVAAAFVRAFLESEQDAMEAVP